MAERGDLPPVLATTDPQTGAPRMAIGLTWLLACGLSLSGTFVELAVLGVVARFAQYIPTCLAVLVFRKRLGPGEASAFRADRCYHPHGRPVPDAAGELGPQPPHQGGIALLVSVPLYFLSRRAGWAQSTQ